MIVGEHSRDTDLDVWISVPFTLCIIFQILAAYLAIIAFPQINPVRAKELTNVRAAGKDENVKLSPPRLVCICWPL